MKFQIEISDGDLDLIARRFSYEPQVMVEEETGEKALEPNPESRAAFVARQIQGLIAKEVNHQVARETQEEAKRQANARRKKAGMPMVQVVK